VSRRDVPSVAFLGSHGTGWMDGLSRVVAGQELLEVNFIIRI